MREKRKKVRLPVPQQTSLVSESDFGSYNGSYVRGGSGGYIDSSITAPIGKLYNLCVFLCFWSEQSNNKFPLFTVIMFDTVRKQLQEISLGLEDDAIKLHVELCEEAVKETRYSLVVKPVNPRKQNLHAMLSALPRLWGVGDEVTGRILENKKFSFCSNRRNKCVWC